MCKILKQQYRKNSDRNTEDWKILNRETYQPRCTTETFWIRILIQIQEPWIHIKYSDCHQNLNDWFLGYAPPIQNKKLSYRLETGRQQRISL